VEAETRRATANLSDRSADVLRFVQANVDGVRAKEVAEHVDGITSAKDAGTYLGRLFKRGQVTRSERGLYRSVGSVGGVGILDLFLPTHPTLPAQRHDAPDPYACERCGLPMNPSLVTLGHTTHPACD